MSFSGGNRAVPVARQRAITPTVCALFSVQTQNFFEIFSAVNSGGIFSGFGRFVEDAS
ncbi:MAG TPA: hypothetical protein VFT72_19525 [Opitutaceae bacterium]|nr:hypothetical protein [Opitutaceae bacterium]